MPELDLAERTAQSLALIRERTPLIHNITNFVVMNETANVLLALGASPVMAHAIEEVREMVGYAGAFVDMIQQKAPGLYRKFEPILTLPGALTAYVLLLAVIHLRVLLPPDLEYWTIEVFGFIPKRYD